MKIYYKIAIIVLPLIIVSIICVNNFLPRHAAAEEKQFNFVAVGDLDCNNNSKKTFNNTIDKKPEIFLALGDIYYDCKPDEFKKALILNVDVTENSLKLKSYTNKDFRTPKDTFTIVKGHNTTKPIPMLKYIYINTSKGNGVIPTSNGLIEIPFENGTVRIPVKYNYTLPH